jgi:ferric-dicitrate binding protein FerR (iron transport regulator)
MEKDKLIDLAVESCYENEENSKQELVKGISSNKDNSEIKQIIQSLNVTKANSVNFNSIQSDFDKVFERIDVKPKLIKLISFVKYVAAAIVLITVGVCGYLYNDSTIEYLTLPNQQTMVSLNDLSTVTMLENSSLKVSNEFSIHNRKAIFEGVGYFSIKKDPSSVFEIRTDYGIVKVLGTKFKLNSEKSSEEFKLFLQEGLVQLELDNYHKPIMVNPNQQVIFNKNTGRVKRITLSNRIQVDAKAKRIEFVDEVFNEIVKCLNIVYNKKVIVNNDKVYKARLSGTFNKHSVQEILESFKPLIGYEISENEKGDIVIN